MPRHWAHFAAGLDVGKARRHQQQDRLFDLLGNAMPFGAHYRFNQFVRMIGKCRISGVVGPIKVAWMDDKAVALGIEFRAAAEQPPVDWHFP